MTGDQTYWLYFNGEPLTAVRLPPGADIHDVRCEALSWLDRVPLCNRPNESPGDRMQKIHNAQVYQFPDSKN